SFEAKLQADRAALTPPALSPAAALASCQALAVDLAMAAAEKQPELRRRLNARLRDLLEGVFIYRQDLGPRKAAIYVPVWPRAGRAAYSVLLAGRPPGGAELLDLPAVDLRRGYPIARAGAGK